MKKTRDVIQNEALKEALRHKRCGISLSMGVGKTLVGLMYMEQHYTDTLRVLVVGPKVSVLETWKKEADKHEKEYLRGCMDFTTYLSLTKRPNHYDLVILDECHNLLDSHREWLDGYEGKILGLSGTMPKYESSEKGRMVAEYCPVVYTYSTDDAVGDDILNDYRIVVHELELNTAKTLKVDGKAGNSWYTSERLNYEYWTSRVFNCSSQKQQQIMRVMRMKALMGFKSKEEYAKKLLTEIKDKCIVFCNTQEQAEKLCPHSYHSNNPDSDHNLEMLQNGEIMQLSAVNQLSEGVNIKGLKQAVILHSFSGSSPKSQQKLGRILRLNPDEVATLHLLVYKNSIDETWANSVLELFDSSKIVYKNKVKTEWI
jgi:superfamily II DNA or RNA helicase